MMDRIKTLGEEKEEMRMEKEVMQAQISNLQTEAGRLQSLSSPNSAQTAVMVTSNSSIATKEITDRSDLR